MLEGYVLHAFHYLQSGGVTMIPLAGLSVWMWFLVFVKILDMVELRSLPRTGNERGNAPDIRDQREAERLLTRHVDTIMVLARAAPLLGLLGTVSGMISTFGSIALFGAGDARALSSGISEALVTTQCGLVVAVPGLLAGHFFKSRAQARGKGASPGGGRR